MTTLTNPIVQYVYKENKNKRGEVLARRKIGCIVAGISCFEPHKVVIGFSQCHKNDKYDYIREKKVYGHGKIISEQRAYKWSDKDEVNIPFIVKKELPKFLNRCKSYYKDKNIVSWATKI